MHNCTPNLGQCLCWMLLNKLKRFQGGWSWCCQLGEVHLQLRGALKDRAQREWSGVALQDHRGTALLSSASEVKVNFLLLGRMTC